jgi:transcription termination factor Rho
MSHSLQSKHLADLHDLAREQGVDRYRMMSRTELIEALGGEAAPEESAGDRVSGEGAAGQRRSRGRGRNRSGSDRRGGRGGGRRGNRERDAESDFADAEDTVVEDEEGTPVTGVLEITSRGHGFVRREEDPDDEGDVYVSPSQIRRCELSDGDVVSGPARKPRRGERHPALIHIDTVNGSEPGGSRSRFEDLEPKPPHRRLPLGGEKLEGDERTLIRSLDQLVTLARGQRVLVEASRGSGRTTLMRALARELSSHEELGVVVVLIDERPEEAPAWREALGDEAELAIATADMRPKEQLRLVELAVSQAKRRVEGGEDVVVLIDSLSRLAVAADDPGAAKPIFAAGRETADEEAGALTMIATVLSDGDDGVAAALATTENVSLALDAELAAAGVYPAIVVDACRVTGEEELREDEELAAARELRAQLARLDAREAAEKLAAETQ